MRTDYSAIALVVDRSGSMQPIANDVKGSVQHFIGEQKKNEGKATFTLVQFDDQYEVVHNFTHINNVDEHKFAEEYSPRGGTALLDAIGRTTIELTQRIAEMPLEERPAKVIVAVLTDGEENSSTSYNLAKINALIKQKEAEGWQFMFLGAGRDAMKEARNMGFSEHKSAYFETSQVESCIGLISKKVSDARRGEEVNICLDERQTLIFNPAA